MKLTIDNREIEARTGQTLLELVKALGWIRTGSPPGLWRRRSPVRPLP